MKIQSISGFMTVATAAIALALAACGGGGDGAGGGGTAVGTFLGTGGGQFEMAPRPLTVDYALYDNTLTLSRSAAQVDTTPPDLYASGYDVYVANTNGPLVASCKGASGRVQGDRVTIAGCFTGRYVNINYLLSDDGTKALFHTITPDLIAGLWVDLQDSSHSVKFAGQNTACEYAGGTKRPASYQVRGASVTQAGSGDPIEMTTAGLTSLVVTGGRTWTGEFVGISGLRLTSGTTIVDLQRRNLIAPSACP